MIQMSSSLTKYANNYVTRLVIPNVQEGETAEILVGETTNGMLRVRSPWMPSQNPD